MTTLSKHELRMFRDEAWLGICSDPRREFGRDYRILALLDDLDTLTARLAKVEALADEWEHFRSCEWGCEGEVAADLRAALASDPTHTQNGTQA